MANYTFHLPGNTAIPATGRDPQHTYADTDAGKPTGAGVKKGDTCFAADTGKIYKCTVDGSFNVEVGGGGGGGTTVNTGEASLDFGAFPGKSFATVAVTGQTGIVSGSFLQAWLFPKDTADHKADEHVVETLAVRAGNIVPGTGFTIYGANTSQLNEPVVRFRSPNTNTLAPALWTPAQSEQWQTQGGRGTRIYGVWNVGWLWI